VSRASSMHYGSREQTRSGDDGNQHTSQTLNGSQQGPQHCTPSIAKPADAQGPAGAANSAGDPLA